MPEILDISQIERDPCPFRKTSRPSSASTRGGHWSFLPYELWLTILVDYGLTSNDFINLDYSCKWFINDSYWRGKINILNFPL